MGSVKENLKKNALTGKIYKVLSKVYNFRYKLMSDEKYAKTKYKKRMGIDLNLENPKTFDEKLWWLKINYHNPLITICSDKYWVREYLKLLGYEDLIVELYAVYDKFDDIEFEDLPDRFFIKTTHGSGTNIIYDRNKPFDYKKYRKIFKKSLKTNYFDVHREWGYKNIEPKIICEKILVEKGKVSPMDYKLFCFNGKVEFVTVTLSCSHEDGSHRDTVEKNFYDRNFNYIDVRFSDDNFDPRLVEKPKNLDKMIEIAERLSKPFPEVRVDMYNIDGKIYFSEMTFYHNGGYNESTPKDFVEKMGDMIKISVENNRKYRK